MRAIYMEDSKSQHRSTVTKMGSSEINKKFYNWIQLSETIFHPKGGGQPSDEGAIAGVKIAFAHKELYDKNFLNQFEIYHCFEVDQPFNFKVGDEVELIVDASTRLLHSRLHTAGHVLADAVNKSFPELKAYQGNHHPNNSYVRFKIQAPLQTENREIIKEKVEAEFKAWLDQDLKVEHQIVPSGIRNVKVFQNWSPCGGTHVNSLQEICQISILDISINRKEDTMTIKYEIN